MLKIKQTPLKLLCLALAAGLTVSYSYAQTYQYNVFVKGFKGKAGSGNGEVIIDPDNPDDTGAKTPILEVSSQRLIFDSSTGTSSQTALRSAALSRIGTASTNTSTSATIPTAPVTEPLVATLTNVGTRSAVFAGLPEVKGYTVASDCGLELTAGNSCNLTVTSQVEQPGRSFQILNIDVVGSPSIAVMLETRLPGQPTAELEFDKKILDFGQIDLALPATLSTKLSNIGDAPGAVTGLTVPTPFTVSHDCGGSLAAGASCTVAVTLNAEVEQTLSETLTVPQANNTLLQLPLKAKAQSSIQAARFVLEPDSIKVGELSKSLTLTGSSIMTNKGNIAGSVGKITSNDSFKVDSDCGTSLEPGASCVINAELTNTQPGFHYYPLAVNGAGQDQVLLKISGTITDTSGTRARLVFDQKELAFGTLPSGQAMTLSGILKNSGAQDASLKSIKFSPTSPEYKQTNNCPAVLTSGQSCDVSVTFQGANKQVTQTALVATTADDMEAGLDLSGVSAYAQLKATSTVDFGTVLANGNAATRPIVLSNGGVTPITGIAAAVVSGPYSVTANNCLSVIEALKSCTVQVAFTPTGVGSQSGQLSVPSANGGTVTVQLSGTGTLSDLQVSSNSLTFADTAIGSNSKQNLTLTNKGPDAAPIDSIGMYLGKAEFNQSNNCSGTLQSGASCTIAVQFTPTVVGAREGGLAVQGVYNPALTVDLAGSAFLQKLIVGPTVVSFGDILIGTAAPVKTVTLSNPSEMAATLSKISVTANDAVFVQTNNCPASLSNGQSCTISVQGTPSSASEAIGAITVQTSFADYNIPLSVTGTKPVVKFTPVVNPGDPELTADGYLQFKDTVVGQTSPTRTVTLANTGTGPLTIVGISVTSGINVFGQSNNCGTSLAVDASCTVTMAFSPQATGTSKGFLTVITSSGQYNLGLTGNSATSAGVWSGSATNFGSIGVGSSKQLSFSFRNAGSSDMPVSTELIGNDLSFTLNNCGTAGAPVTLAKGESCAVLVTYAPSAFPSKLTGAMLSTSSPSLSKPVTYALSGEATGYQLAFDASSNTDFGTIQTGGAYTRNFYLRNASKLPDTLASTATISGMGYSILNNTCLAGKVMSANSTCLIQVSLNVPTPATPGVYTAPGVIAASTINGASASLNLTANYTEVAMPLVWTADKEVFPTVTPGSWQSAYYWLNNKTTAAIKLTSGVVFESSDPTHLYVFSNSCTAGTTLAANTGRCFINIAVKIESQPAAGDYLFTGHITGYHPNGTPVSYDMSYSYTQTPYTAKWDGPSDFGVVAAGTSPHLTTYFRNTSSNKLTIATPITISGDPQFKLTSNGCKANDTLLTTASTYCFTIVTFTAPTGMPPGEYHYSAVETGYLKEGNWTDSMTLTATVIQEPYTMALSGVTDFGSVKGGSAVAKTITLKNTSQSPEKLVGASLSGLGFTFNANSCTANVTLAAGGTCSMTVRAVGIAGQTQTADLTVTNTQGVSETVSLIITSP